MAEAARTGAKHLALEMLVVISSILIAFSLDAWWGRRAEARTEESHLRALESDFEQNVARLQRLLDREHRIMDASQRLLLEPGVVDGRVLEDSAEYYFGQVFNSGRFDPVMGAYEAVVGSGGLSQLRDDSLRLALADFASLLQSRYTERYADELYLDFIRSYTGRLGIAGAVAGGDSAGSGQGTWASQRTLLEDPEFREHLALRYLAERDVAAAYQGLQQKAQQVLELARRARN